MTTAIERVEIADDSGDVTVRALDVQTSVVRQVFRRLGGASATAYRVEGTTLRLDGCGADCSVRYDVTVPLGTAIRGGSDSGDITVEGAGAVRVRTGSGDITVEGAGDVRAHTGSGDIALRIDTAGSVSAVAGSGDIALTSRDVDEVSARAGSGGISLRLGAVSSVEARTGSGDVEAAFPPGSYRVLGDSAGGDRTIEVSHEPSAGRVLRLTTSSGDVVVRRG